MKRFATVALTGFALLLMAAVAAMLSMRVAIHGREVSVPDLAGLSDSDAAAASRKLGLNLSVENRFYSAAVPANHVLSQAPAAGARVRRGSQVRVTESLGGQHVAAPDLRGESERPALLILSHLQLDLAPEAHLPAPEPSGIVLAQSPPPGTADATGPRVALLISGPQPDSATFAYVMPRITGMSIASAADLLATAGLHLASATDTTASPVENAPVGKPGTSEPGSQSQPNSSPSSGAKPVQGSAAQTIPPDPAIAPTVSGPTPPASDAAAPQIPGSPPAQDSVNPEAIIATQFPQPGNRVTRADAIRVTTTHSAAPDGVSQPQ